MYVTILINIVIVPTFQVRFIIRKEATFGVNLSLDGYIVCPDDEPKIPCEAQYEEFQNIYTWFLLTSAIAPVVFEPIQRKFGTFVARSIIGTLTTVGIIILLFYEENNYLIWIAWQLLGIPTFMYLVVNIQVMVSK